jgi:hypothetical protein
MARLYPSNLEHIFKAAEPTLSPGLRAEYQTAFQLRDALPDYLTIFYSQHWGVMDGKRFHSREVDFVVVNPAGDCIVIEQKMGDLEETASGLVKTYQDGRKSIVEQILDSFDGLKNNFKRVNGAGLILNLSYILFCPDYKVTSYNASGLDPNSIIDKSNRNDLAKLVQVRLRRPSAQPTEQGELVLGFFKRSFKLGLAIEGAGFRQQQRFAQLTGALSEFLYSVEMDPIRLFISGTAGSGKTIALHHYSQAAVENGKRTLVVCFNTPLATALSCNLPSQIRVTTFHNLFRELAEKTGISLKELNQTYSSESWSHLFEELSIAIGDNEAEYECLIVDEGQDIGHEGFELLKLLLKDGADIVWLEDKDQDLGQRPVPGPMIDASDFVRLHLRANYRSPLHIANFIQDNLPFDFETRNPYPGTHVKVHRYKSDEDQLTQIDAIVEAFLKQGFKPDEIAVVSCKGMSSTPVLERDEIGGLKVRKFTGAYEGAEQVFTDGELVVETIRRFKGQQSSALVVTDVDPSPEHETDMRVLYCALTRATVSLEIMVDNASWWPENDKK